MNLYEMIPLVSLLLLLLPDCEGRAATALDHMEGAYTAAAKPFASCFNSENNSILECIISPADRQPTKDVAAAAEYAKRPPAKSLRLQCLQRSDLDKKRHHLRDILDSVSLVTEDDDDMWLQGLEELRLTNCQLRDFRPEGKFGRDLRSLAVINCSIYEKIDFRAFPGLQTIDVTGSSDNDDDDLSFCPLRSTLTSLNVSFGGIGRVEDIGLVADCPMEKLFRLDVSNNVLKRLPRHGISASLAFGLRELELGYNSIEVVEDSALDGLGGQLQVLGLSHNRISSLPVALFGTAAEGLALRELYLANNSLAGIPSALLERLSHHLVVLNLSHNAIADSWLDSSPFESLRRLVVLDLSHNRLTAVTEVSFRGLNSLQVLTLAHNQIMTMSELSFVTVPTLQALVLSHNLLEDLSEGSLATLKSLNSLAADHNRIKGLHRSFFSNTSSLSDLALQSNQLRHFPHVALAPLSSSLRTLDLGENEMTEVKSLSGLTELYGLRLAGNRIRRLGDKTFDMADNIKMLNLADNQISHIEQDAFRPLKKLKALRLDNNLLEDLNGLLTTQHHLQWLNVSFNRLQWFDYAFVPKSLLWLNLRGNQIEELGNYYDMQSGFQLAHLDVAGNRLQRLDKESLVHSLKEVFASDNLIEELAANTLTGLANLTLVNLARNKLAKFSLNSLALSIDNKPGRRMELHLSGNPLECDCDMEWLQRINELAEKSPSEFPHVVDWSNITCSLNSRNSSSTTRLMLPLPSVQPSEFLCAYQTHCFALCMCCDFFACDCRMKCSEGCDCYHDQTWSSNIIQCGKRDRKSVPEFIPMDATAVYLDGNNLTDLSSETFVGRKHLVSLFLNSSGIERLSNKTFGGLSELLVLHLDRNAISELKGDEFADLVSLRELHLDHNRLSSIHAATFELLGRLEVLTLAGNRLASFPVWRLAEVNVALKTVTLSDNPWSCQCEYLHRAQRFVREKRLIVSDADEIKCVEKGVTSVAGNASCADVMAVSFRSDDSNVSIKEEENGGGSLLIPVVAVVAAALVFVVSVLILAVAFRRPVSRWLHSKCSSPHLPPPSATAAAKSVTTGKASQYDAYVHYNVKDSAFAHQSLSGPLSSSGLRVVLHHRDVSKDSISTVAGASSCIIIIASSDYLRSHNESELKLILDSKNRNNEHPSVVVVSLSSVDSEKRLRSLVFGHQCIILRWSDSNFWQRLHNLLPAPQQQTTQLDRRTLANNSANEYEDDLWTYVKGGSSSGGSSHNNPDSSTSTRSTNDSSAVTAATAAATLPMNMRRSNVIVNPLQQSPLPLLSSSSSSSDYRMKSATAGGRGSGRNSRRRSDNVLQQQQQDEAGYVSVNDSLGSHRGGVRQEPIYHTLEPSATTQQRRQQQRKKSTRPTVYINADLEVVYPKPGELQQQQQLQQQGRFLDLLGDNEEEEDEEELLVEDEDLEEEEGLYDDDRLFVRSYVPSPAPGSFPRQQQQQRPQFTPRSSRQQQPPPPMSPFEQGRQRSPPTMTPLASRMQSAQNTYFI